MIAEILAVGSEMLTPHRQDTNSLYLTAGLNDLGVSVGFKTIVGDNRAHLVDAARVALSRADVVVFSGGLGPTEDDLTRECAAEALGVRLYQDQGVLESLRRRFAARQMAMPANNARQADVLEGAEVLANANGSAPGQYLDTDLWMGNGVRYRKIVVLLPGPPKELKPLFDDEVKPRLAKSLPARFLARRVLRMALIPESHVDARCAPIYSQFSDVETTILAGSGEIQLHFVCTKPSKAAAEERLKEVVERICAEMGDDIYSTNGDTLEQVVLHLLDIGGHTLSVAESCTGGWLGERLTSAQNSSRVFGGGVIAYSNESKTTLTGIAPQVIEEQGAVNQEVAARMAEGVRRLMGTSLGVSITGIAGPGVPAGPDAGRPVGLVYVGLATAEGTRVREVKIAGDRERVRLWATQHALEMIRLHLL